ncbi:hypothetical protein Franean1_2901 [Parafrankia sp. EAN1pec]|nr:hypothetical protein Franean1_2901 [Frankia sp. EAN1pec]
MRCSGSVAVPGAYLGGDRQLDRVLYDIVPPAGGSVRASSAHGYIAKRRPRGRATMTFAMRNVTRTPRVAQPAKRALGDHWSGPRKSIRQTASLFHLAAFGQGSRSFESTTKKACLAGISVFDVPAEKACRVLHL